MLGDNRSAKAIEMLVAFGQHQRRSAFPNGLHDFVADQPIAGSSAISSS